jgi:hypothetical protein
VSGTERLARELVRDLEPVRPLPRLRWVLAAVIGTWLAVAAGALLLGAWSPLTGPGSPWRDAGFVAFFTGLLTTALGALAVGIASGVPGRGDLARLGRTAAQGGAVLALCAGLAHLVLAAAHASQGELAQHLSCAGRACALGIVPAGFACAFLARAFPGRPLFAVVAATSGAVVLGAATVHAGCGLVTGTHWLLGHSLVPAAGAILLSLPLAGWVGRRIQRDPSSRA